MYTNLLSRLSLGTSSFAKLRKLNQIYVDKLELTFNLTGLSSVLIQYLQLHSLKDPEEYAKQKTIALSTLTSSSDIKRLSDVSILTQAGYLTIKHIDCTTVCLDYPNDEVKTVMAQL